MIFLLAIETEDDKNKMNELFEQYYRLMYKIAYEVLNNHNDVEDVLQDSFEKIARNLEHIGDTKCKETRNFLAVITFNTAIDLYRQKKRRWEKEEELRELNKKRVPCTYMKFEGDCEAQLLLEAIHKLPFMYREVLSLKYTNQCSIKEISKLLNVSETNVKQRIFRAKRMLEEEMKKQMEQ